MDNTEHIRRLFNSIASESPDPLSALMGWNIYNDYEKLRLKHMLMMVDVPRTSILDAGCGMGRNIDVYEDLDFGRIVGLDGAHHCVEKAQAAYPKLEFAVADLESIPFEDNSFETVVCAYVMTHISDDGKVQRVADELGRVSSGCVIIYQCMDKERISGEGGPGGKLRSMTEFEEMFPDWTVEHRLRDWCVYSESIHDADDNWIPNVHRTSYLVLRKPSK